MTIEKNIYSLISGSVIEKLIDQVIEIDIGHPYGISKLKGAYALIYEKGKPYFGSTKDIHKRCVDHRRLTKQIITNVLFFQTNDMVNAVLLEDWLISNLDCTNEINAIRKNKTKTREILRKFHGNSITIGIDDEAHHAILIKKSQIYLKTNKKVRITDLATEAILAGIDLIEDDYDTNN